VGCFVGTIMYAFYLSETRKDSQFCTVPIISMKREDLITRFELKWLIKSCGMDESNLVFIDEVQVKLLKLYLCLVSYDFLSCDFPFDDLVFKIDNIFSKFTAYCLLF